MTSETTTAKNYEDFTEVKVAILIDRIYIPMVVSLGLVGNVLCFLTLVFSSLRRTSTCVYMAAIAVLDSVILVLDLCVLVRGYTGHTRFYLHSHWACGFHNFLFYFAIHFDVVLLLAMTVDRFIVVRFPLKAPALCTPRSALKAVAAVGLFSFALNFHIFFTRRLGESGIPDDPQRCWYPDPDVDYFMKKVYTWIDASVYSFVPFLSLLVLNVLIIKQLRASRRFSRQFTETAGVARGQKNTCCSSSNNSSSSKSHHAEENSAVTSEMETSNTDLNCSELELELELERCSNSSSNSNNGATVDFPRSTTPPDKAAAAVLNGEKKQADGSAVFTISGKKDAGRTRGQRGSRGAASVRRGSGASSASITVMFLLVSFTFLLLTSPVVIVLLYKRYYWLPSTPGERASARLTHAVVDNLMYTNHAVNFLLYCLSGTRFRQELKRLLVACLGCCCCCCCRR